MAYHFSANQYEDKYSPRKLGNWEYPKWYPDRPRQRFERTKVIADNNGRLLDGIKRENPWGNYVGTWDLPRRITREYVKKLVAPPERLVKLWGKKKEEPPEQPPPPLPEEAAKEAEQKTDYLPTPNQNTSISAQRNFDRRNKSCSALDLRPRPTKLEPLAVLQEKKENLLNIKPETLDEKIKNIIESVEEKQKSSLPSEIPCKEIRALPRDVEKEVGENFLGQEFKSNVEENYKLLSALHDGLNNSEKQDEVRNSEELDKTDDDEKFIEMKTSDSLKTEKSLQPLTNVAGAQRIAKKFHDDNLKHKPLPDVIDDPIFKALNSGRQPNPGGGLNVQAMPSAIGWKYYTAPGPTECSKLKVYRPKTAVDKIKPQKEPRPKTGSSTYRRRFLPIDLAICWDLKPEDPLDEPKRSPHIDGSNGSVAPAVFTMIRPTETEEEEQSILGSCKAVADRIEPGINKNNAATLPSQLNGKVRTPMSVTSNREAIMTCVTSSQENRQKQKSDSPQSINSISTNAAEYARKNPKTAWTHEDTSKALSDKLYSLQKENGTKKCISSQMTRKKHHQSTPNVSATCEGSHCGTEKSSSGSSKMSELSKSRSLNSSSAARLENIDGSVGEKKSSDSIKAQFQQKNEHKKNRNCTACEKTNCNLEEPREKNEFKAAFKAGVPKSESSNSGSSSAAKSYKVPKMRLPYAKRSYSIGTLAPPFSLWRENNGQEYPEHWRLASVYQHSYKPINTRKRPLLASVYQ